MALDTSTAVTMVSRDNELAATLDHCSRSGEFVMLQLENGEILWVVPPNALADLAAIANSKAFRASLAESLASIPNATACSSADVPDSVLGQTLAADVSFRHRLSEALSDVSEGTGEAHTPVWRPSPRDRTENRHVK